MIIHKTIKKFMISNFEGKKILILVLSSLVFRVRHNFKW